MRSPFPRASCGDVLPTQSSEYPIDFYPVFIDFSEENLETVKDKFCRDSYPTSRENKQYIKVASFSDYKKAEEFKSLMSKTFNNAEIGSPITIKKPQ